MNIILIVSDTLRRDHLGCYGNTFIRTPHLDTFAEQAVVFENCHPASFPTVPARADLMTGRYTFLYLPWGPLPQGESTLAATLAAAGYTTAAVVDTPFLTRNGYGLDRGFQEFVYVRGQLDGTERELRQLHRGVSEVEGYCAPKTFSEAAGWLERHHGREPFFLYIDTWDPHEPWDPPDYYVKPYAPDYQGEVIHPTYWEYRDDGVTDEQLRLAHACYCGEVSMVDHWFGFLMERLRVLNLADNTAVLFVSDHGFYFGEHGLFGKRRFRWLDGSSFAEGFRKGLRAGPQQVVHRSPLHNELTQVPLLARLPGEAPRRVSGLVSLPDLMPTILELAGATIPERVQAHSILPLLNGRPVNAIVVTSAPFEELGQLSKTVDDKAREVVEVSPGTVTDGQWDLLYSVAGQKVELFRTREDRGHHNNVYGDNRSVAQDLHRRYVAWLEANGAPAKALEPRQSL